MKKCVPVLTLLIMTAVGMIHDCTGREVDHGVLDKLAKLSKITNCGLTVTSGFRTREKNEAVGGAKNSHHLTGNAVDVVIDQGCRKTKGEIAAWAVIADFTGIIVYSDHIHLDTRKNLGYVKL